MYPTIRPSKRPIFPGPRMALLDIHNLTVWYESLFGDLRALHRCSLSIPEGHVVSLLGVNGAGKTSLFMTISGVLKEYDGKVTEGHIRFLDKDILGIHAAVIVSLGLVHAPQGRHIFHSLSVADNLLLGGYTLRGTGGGKKRIGKNTDRIYHLFPVLAEKRGQSAGSLSGGEQQMLNIGRALMSAPSMMLLDEPFLGLAPLVIRMIAGAVTRLKEEGLTLCLAEQNTGAVLPLSDQVYMMDRGYIYPGGDPGALKENPAYTRLFPGDD
jgi:branched-chain amino acid transport system ATP-binding protein